MELQTDNNSARGSEEDPKKEQHKSRRPPSKTRRAWKRGERELMESDRQCLQATAAEGMATYPHTKDSPAAVLRRRCHIRAHRRCAAVGKLDGPRDHH